MNIFIAILVGVMAGIIIGLFLKRSPKSRGKASALETEGRVGLTNELIEEKQKNLEKARAFIRGKEKITNDDLQKELGVSDATIVRYLNDLEAEGLIRQVGKTGQSVYYDVI
ncbi:MAG: deoR-type protein [Candidatus Berkelbacteria bacterium]|nr:deoR-type protein [Candidatus Berkelbacteria bacterium]